MDGLNPYLKSGKTATMNKLWNQILQKEAEIQQELGECRRRGERTPRYHSLAQDMQKLKTEYEKVKGTGTFDPNDHGHHDRIERQNVLGTLNGRVGEDTHFGPQGDLDRPK